MFWAIGAKYSPAKTKKFGWYRENSWSIREEKRFEAWLVAEIRRDFRVNNRTAKQNAGMFLLNYGWSLRLER